MRGRNFAALTIASLAFGAAAVAQQPAQPSAYQGVSQPPNDPITTSPDAPPAPPAKPAAGVLAAPAPVQQQPMPSSPGPVSNYVPQDGSQQALAARHLLTHAVRQKSYEILDRDFVAAVVDLDVVPVQIDGAVGITVNGAREGIARVACHIIGQHEDNLRIWDPETLHGAVEGEHVGQMAVVEPEARG